MQHQFFLLTLSTSIRKHALSHSSDKKKKRKKTKASLPSYFHIFSFPLQQCSPGTFMRSVFNLMLSVVTRIYSSHTFTLKTPSRSQAPSTLLKLWSKLCLHLTDISAAFEAGDNSIFLSPPSLTLRTPHSPGFSPTCVDIPS